jgi:hypothetical protein
MSLLHYLHQVSLTTVASILIVVSVVFATGLMLGTRFAYGVDRLRLNNEVAGFKFAVIGVFYAVLLAFVVVAVWENYQKTEGAVRDEAKAVVDLHRITFGLPAEAGAEIRTRLIAYTKNVRDDEWKTMAEGKPSEAVTKDLERLSKAILGVNPESSQDLALYQNALELLAGLTDNRYERLDSSDGSVPGVLWFTLIVGGLITLGYPAFFGSTNVVAQILMTASLAVLVAIALLLGIVFDYPFTGAPTISSLPFDQALQQMSAGRSSP